MFVFEFPNIWRFFVLTPLGMTESWSAQFSSANEWANRCNGPNIGDNRTPLIVEIHRN